MATKRGIPLTTVTQVRGSAEVRAGSGLVTALRTAAVQVRDIKVGDIATNPLNPRRSLGDLGPLADSLVNLGQYVPIIVVSAVSFAAAYPQHTAHVGQRAWVVMAGHRRLAAAAQAGLPTVNAVVRDDLMQPSSGGGGQAGVVDAAALTSVIENLHRAQLSPLEEAGAFQMLKDMGLTQTQIAHRSGVSQGQVSKRLSLMRLPTPVQDSVARGDLEIGTAVTVAAGLHARSWTGEDVVAVLADLEKGAGTEPTLERERSRRTGRAQATQCGAATVHEGWVSWGHEEKKARTLTCEAAIRAAAQAGELTAYINPATGQVGYYTTGPVQTPAQDPEGRESGDRQRLRATRARASAAAALARRVPSKRDWEELMIDAVMAGTSHAGVWGQVFTWLRDRFGDRGARSHGEWEKTVPADDKTRRALAWALAVAQHENQVRSAHHGAWDAADARYLDLLVRQGYVPTSWEQARLEEARATGRGAVDEAPGQVGTR